MIWSPEEVLVNCVASPWHTVVEVKLAVGSQVPVEFFGRLGGMVPTPEEIEGALRKYFSL